MRGHACFMKSKRYALGPKFSEGARLLWSEMHRCGLRPADVTRALEASPGVVVKWLYGDRRPGRAWAERIAAEFQISPARWDEPPSQPFVLLDVAASMEVA